MTVRYKERLKIPSGKKEEENNGKQSNVNTTTQLQSNVNTTKLCKKHQSFTTKEKCTGWYREIFIIQGSKDPKTLNFSCNLSCQGYHKYLNSEAVYLI
jgi:hypothetical protein